MSSSSSEDISGRAHGYVEKLTGEIGVRPAGSQAEFEAQEWAGSLLGAKGLKLEWFDAPFRQPSPFLLQNFISGMGLAAAAETLASGFPWLSLAMPLLVAILPEIIWLIRRNLAPDNGLSANLLVRPAETPVENLDLILVAHADTARARPPSTELWYQWREQSYRTVLRVGLILAVMGLMQAVGFALPPAIPQAARFVAWLMAAVLLIQDLWEQFGARGRFSPGANDNASGMAVVTALAEHLADNPPEIARVGFLFSGAEEAGLFGARQFAAYLAEKEFKGMVVSVDMVGAGWGLRAISSTGTFFRLESDREVLELLERADPEIERFRYERRSGDFEPFVRAGIHAAGIEADGTKRSWRAYHSVGDSLDVIDPEMLTHTINALRQLVWLVDKGKKNFSPQNTQNT